MRVHGADIPTPYAESLEKKAFPQIDDIVESVKRVLYKKK
jgi:pyruvate dehydrogenase E1 component beta subunit